MNVVAGKYVDHQGSPVLYAQAPPLSPEVARYKAWLEAEGMRPGEWPVMLAAYRRASLRGGCM
jgi:hypothetical protein